MESTKIVGLDGSRVERFHAPAPQDDVDAVAGILRRGISKYQQMAADIRRQTKATVASLEADIAALNARIAETKTKSKADIAAAQRLVASNKAALEALDDD